MTTIRSATLVFFRLCRDTDEATGELLVHGFRGKGFDRVPDQPDVSEPLRPWVVVDVVHATIGLLEDLHDLPLLFPSSLTNAHDERPATVNARTGRTMNDDTQDLISWINSMYRRAVSGGRSWPILPAASTPPATAAPSRALSSASRVD
ncbi:hypothetical protein ACFXOD_26645 [Streptomyces sp. NPDC059161]|uniref:hypothetical protein n=1 Tax=Streptomyces sp. NPDC059161 TaxID=3346749 RepID=UPI0036A03071